MSVTQENGLEKICKQPFVVLATSYLQDLHLSAHKTTVPRTRAARRQSGGEEDGRSRRRCRRPRTPREAKETKGPQEEVQEAKEAQDTPAEAGMPG